jgi:hypothetical protein
MRSYRLLWVPCVACWLAGCGSVQGDAFTSSAAGSGGVTGGGGTAGTGGGAITGGSGGAAATGGSGGQAGSGPPVLLGQPQGSGANIHNGFLALDTTNVYFGYMGNPSGGIDRVPKDGSLGPSCILCDAGVPRDLATDGVHVYWTDNGVTPNEVRRVLVGGGTVETLWTGQLAGGPPTPVAIDASHVYWYDNGGGNVMQATLDGSNPTAVGSSSRPVLSIQLHGSVLYFSNNSDVWAQDLSTPSSPVQLATGRPEPRSIAVDSSHVYWAEGQWNQPDNAVQRVPLGGGSMETCATMDVTSIAIDATDVYGVDGAGGVVWRVAKGGGLPTILATGQPNPWDIAVDSSHVYWTSESTGEVYRLAK